VTDSTIHVPVLLRETLDALAICQGDTVVDGTLGGGGHTLAIAERVGPGGLVISLDRDLSAIDRFDPLRAGLPIRLAQADFSHLPEVLDQLDIDRVDSVLLDLGMSSDQLADESRGFSFHSTGPLDLRFDPSEGDPAWRLLERLSRDHIADLLYTFGEERLSRKISAAIVKYRSQQPLRRAIDLATLVSGVYPSRRTEKIHPATRCFQALRIAVNDELCSLETALRRIPDRIRGGGRFGVISFHSLEDRRVKHGFRDDSRLLVTHIRSITADDDELSQNPRARSARLRYAERLPDDA
jgi:16S rRNA (cytosine1402-N4)-methyltransferase